MLPTRAELALRYREFDQADQRRQRIASGLFIAALFGNLLVIRWLEPYGAGWMLVPLFVAEFAASLAVAAGTRRRARAAGVGCRVCGAAFTARVARQIVVATGTCVDCAAPVASDAVRTADAGAFEVGWRDEDVPLPHSAPTGAAATKGWILVVLVSLGVIAYGVASVRGQNGLTPATGVTVEQAAARIAATRGRPSLVLLYGTACRPKCRVLADFAAMARRHPDVDVLAFSVDERGAPALPVLLWRHDANFAPVYLRHWPTGALTAAMLPLGIHIGTVWTPHLIAVRDAEGRVVMHGEAVQDVAPFESALDRLR